MATFRTTLLFLVLVLVLVIGVYFTVAPRAVSATQAPQAFVKDDLYVAACPRVASWLSTEDLRDILNARYEHRVGLPR